MRRIVCAANRNLGAAIILGVRHWDSFMHIQASDYANPEGFAEQGFVDNNREFLTREEAWLVAEKANQIIKRVGGDMNAEGVGKLFSENLY